MTFATPGRRAIETAYARQIAKIAQTVREANKATLAREIREAVKKLRAEIGADTSLKPSDARLLSLALEPLERDTTEASAASRLLAARQIAERMGTARAGVGEGRQLAPEDLAAPYRDGLDWMVKREILPASEVKAVARAASTIRGVEDEKETERVLRRDIMALANSPNVEITAAFQRNIAAAANSGSTMAEYLDQIDTLTADNNLPPFADAYLENVYRTETANIYQAQRLATMDDPDVSDFMWGVELFAVTDARTRPSHGALDGLMLRKGSDAYNAWLPGPPYSYMCRCTSAPVMVGENATEPANALDLVQGIERFND